MYHIVTPYGDTFDSCQYTSLCDIYVLCYALLIMHVYTLSYGPAFGIAEMHHLKKTSFSTSASVCMYVYTVSPSGATSVELNCGKKTTYSVILRSGWRWLLCFTSRSVTKWVTYSGKARKLGDEGWEWHGIRFSKGGRPNILSVGLITLRQYLKMYSNTNLQTITCFIRSYSCRNTIKKYSHCKINIP